MWNHYPYCNRAAELRHLAINVTCASIFINLSRVNRLFPLFHPGAGSQA